MKTVENLGNFPVPGPEGRKTKELYHITRENMLYTIHGATHPVAMNFFVSNDACHLGEIIIPVGEGSRASEPDIHRGDAVIYCEIGPIAFYLPGTKETFLIHEGEAMYLPEGTHYQCVNYTKHAVKGIFMIAPGL